MTTHWAQIAHQQQQNFIRGATPLLMRNHFLWNRLAAAGRVAHQDGDPEIAWKVRIDEPEVLAVSGFEQIEYKANQPYESLVLPWGQYRSVDALHRREEAMVGGRGMVVNRWATKTKDHTESQMRNLSRDIYTGDDENRIVGLESGTAHDNTKTAAADTIAYASDTYGGKSTVLGTKGGTWTTDLSTKPNASAAVDWPYGEGAAKYDWNTPILVKSNSSSWSSQTNNWANDCLEILRYSVEAMRNVAGADGMGDLSCMDGLSFMQLKQKFQANFSINKPDFSGEEDLGFRGEALNFEGVTCGSDSYCPTGNRYVVKPSSIEIRVLNSHGQDGLFYHSGPIWDQREDGWTFQMGSILQVRRMNKGLVRIKDWAHT